MSTETPSRSMRPRDVTAGMRLVTWNGQREVTVEVLYVKKKREPWGATVYLIRTSAGEGGVGEFTRKYTPGAWVQVAVEGDASPS